VLDEACSSFEGVEWLFIVVPCFFLLSTCGACLAMVSDDQSGCRSATPPFLAISISDFISIVTYIRRVMRKSPRIER